MKISYTPKEGRRDVLTILVEEDVWRDVHQAIFGRRPKFPKEVASLSEWIEVFNKLEYQAVKQYVLRRLASQHYHSCQLHKLLIERLVQKVTIHAIIQECVNWGYLDDQAWIESFMRTHLKRAGLRCVMAKLQAKGLPLETVREIAKQWQDPEEEKLAIQRLLQTRYRSKDLTQPKERQKVIAALMRKGYTFDAIRHTLHNDE